MAIQRITQSLLKRYLLRYPPAARLNRYRSLARWSWLKTNLERIKPDVIPDPIAAHPEATAPIASDAIASSGIHPFPLHYQQYRCVIDNPLNCAESLRSTQDSAPGDPPVSLCPLCGFPVPVPEKTLLVGRQGTYRFGRCLGQRGIGRLYEGIQVSSEQAVVIKEYVLPKRYFNDQERQQRQTAFLNLAGLRLADGRHQDLRIMLPIEAIASPLDDRCYLITPVDDRSPTLNTILTQRPPFTGSEVYKILNQILQTLTCLHLQKFTLPMGQVQKGVIHGNLNLASLLWTGSEKQGFTYLTDLILWERLFDPVLIELDYLAREDLTALGQVAFYLLVGRLTDEQGQRLNPKLDRHWPPVYLPLKQFILRLLEIDVPFESADAARQALLNLPPDPIADQQVPVAEVQIPAAKRSSSWLLLLAAIALLGALGGILWLFLRPKPVEAVRTLAPCCFEAVAAVPVGEYTYTTVEGDIWNQILVAEAIAGGLNLADQLSTDQPNFKLTYRPSSSVAAAIDQLRAESVDFAILPLMSPLPLDLASDRVAFDGLAVFVAFNYTNRASGLPDPLNGTISLDDIEQIYTGRVGNWQELVADDLDIRLYGSENPVAIEVFEQRALQREADIAQFRDISSTSIQFLETIPMLQAIIADFEVNGIGSIGFAPLSSIIGQCSIYPLAVKANHQAPVQPFVLDDRQPLRPTVDLCRRKGSYQINAELLQKQTYPLAYPLAVVYLRDNRHPEVGKKFAELLLTQEGQERLQQFGLVSVKTQE